MRRRWRASLAEQVRADRHAHRIIEAQQAGSRAPHDGERINQRSAQAQVCSPRGSARVKEGSYDSLLHGLARGKGARRRQIRPDLPRALDQQL